MTLPDLEKLTDRELDERVADRVMGWSVGTRNAKQIIWWSVGERHADDWHPSINHNDVAAVRAEIERLDEMESFIWNLRQLVKIDVFGKRFRKDWAALNASPRVQCYAALLAVGDNDGK